MSSTDPKILTDDDINHILTTMYSDRSEILEYHKNFTSKQPVDISIKSDNISVVIPNARISEENKK